MTKVIFGSMANILVFLLLMGCARGMPPSAAQPALSPLAPIKEAPAAPDWQKRWDETLAAAKKERVLMVYGDVTPGQRNAIVTSFDNKYGIASEFVIGRGSEISARWNKEHVTLTKFIEGANINPGSSCLMVAAKAPHRDAATVYANWILSKEGQTVYNKPSASPAVRIDVSTEGVDTMVIARPGEKAFLTDERYFETQPVAVQIAREIFAGQIP